MNELNKYKVLVIDPSLVRSGVYFQSRGDGFIDTIEPDKTAPHMDRLNYIYKSVRELICKTHCDLVIIEAYAFQAVGKVVTLGEVGGIVRLALHRKNVPFIEIVPATWKSATLGGRGLPKKTVKDRKYLAERVNYLYNTDFNHNQVDEMDSFLMYQTAVKSFSRSTDGLIKINDQLLAAIRGINRG